MSFLFIGGALFGALLGRWFKVFILIPASCVAIVLVLAAPAVVAQSAAQMVLEIVLLVTGLQFGYAAGLATGNVTALFHGFRKAFASSSQTAESRSLHVR
jgi:uncharacterized membrane protein YoaK (UPF0700 family)